MLLRLEADVVHSLGARQSWAEPLLCSPPLSTILSGPQFPPPYWVVRAQWMEKQ